MIETQFSREALLIGEKNVIKLHNSTVAIYGIGGVGSFVCEALARAGVGNLILVDFDIIDETNINRQIEAMHDTIGNLKTEEMKKRLLKIYPEIKIDTYNSKENLLNETDLIDSSLSYVVDAVDTISTKIQLAVIANERNVPIISCMGTGNKLDPTKFEISDIYKTSVCPLAKVMRKELKKRNVKKLKVLYSKEEPIQIKSEGENLEKRVPASISFVPSVAGLIIAGEVIKDIIK